MGLLTRIFPWAEKRTSLENPQTPLSYPAEWLLDAWNGGRTDSGTRVSELTAFQTTIFLACVDLIASKIGALPMNVYQRVIRNGRTVNNIAADEHTHDLLSLEPNPDMPAFTFKKVLVTHVLAWGNGYAEIQRDASNKVIAIWPRNPNNTRPHVLKQDMTLSPVPWRPFSVSLKSGDIVYKTTDGCVDGGERYIASDDMMHIQGLSFDGRIGQSVVQLARQTIGMALAMDKFGAKYFANFAKPGGILTLPNKIGPEEMEQAKRSWMEAQGGENSHRVAVLPPDMKFTALSNNPQEAQTVEAKKLVRAEICSVFHVPVTMIGDIDKGKANAEQLAQDFLNYCLDPWLQLIKQEFKRKLFPNPDFAGIGRKPQKNNFYVDFDLHNLLRPSAADRQSFYATGFNSGYLSPNDIREMEQKNPIEKAWGDTYYVPVNVQPAERADAVPAPTEPAQQPEPESQPEPSHPEAKSFVPSYSRIFRDALGRVLSRDKADPKAFQRTFQPVLLSISDTLTGHQNAISSDTTAFISDYIGGMFKRSATWSLETADEMSSAELERAIQAIATVVQR